MKFTVIMKSLNWETFSWKKEALFGTIRDCKLAYKTFGKLNEAKDNAILFPHMYSGTHKAMEIYIGEGMALDPSKYFIILPNQLGNGLSSSPHNTPFPFGRGAFPKVRISDDVNINWSPKNSESRLCSWWSVGPWGLSRPMNGRCGIRKW